MKKIISLLITLTLCLSVLPVGITVFADEPVKYTEDMVANLTAYNTANETNEITGNANMDGTYGTFKHSFPSGSGGSIDSSGKYKWATYSTTPGTITYTLDKIEGKQFADLHAATASVYVRGGDADDAVALSQSGQFEARYMYVSDENYFSVILDYANNKVYTVAMNNGTETKTEVAGATIPYASTVNIELDIDGTTVDYNIYNAAGAIGTGSFEVANIEYLKENCTAVSQFSFAKSGGSFSFIFLTNVSYTCSIKDYVAPSNKTFTKYAEDMGANLTAYNTANETNEITGSANMPGTYGTFAHNFPSGSSGSMEGVRYKWVTYSTTPGKMTYKLDKIEGKQFDELQAATATVYVRGSNVNDAVSLSESGQFEMRYMYVSDQNYFSIILDYANNKVYTVAMNNGTETKTEVAGAKIPYAKYVKTELQIAGTNVSYKVYDAESNINVSGTFEVANIKYLKENCTAVSQFLFAKSAGSYSFVLLENVSYTCAVEDKVEKSTYADDIAAAFTASGDNEFTAADANKTTYGKYGTYAYTLTSYASVKNDLDSGGINRLYTYDTGESTVSYNLNRIEGMKLDKLYDAAITLRANKGIADMRYLYKSANDWFGIRLDNTDTAAPKAYAVVKNNGTETKTEIGSIALDTNIPISISIDDTTVSYVVGSLSGSFEVANMADLQENYQYAWQIGFNTNNEKRLLIFGESLTCSIKVAPQVFTEDFESYTSENAAVGTITTYRRNNNDVVVSDKVDLSNAEDKANGFIVAENDESIWKLSKFLDGQSDGMRYESAAFIDQTQHGSDDGCAQTNKNDNRLSLLRGWNYSAVNLYLKEDVYDIQKISFQISGEVLDALTGVRFMVGHGEKTAYEIGNLQNARFFTGKRTGLWENSRSGYAAGTASNGIQATFDKVEAETGSMVSSVNYSDAQYLAYFNVVITMNDTGYDYMVTKVNGGEVVFSGRFEDPSGTRLRPVKGAPVLQLVGLDHGGVVSSLDNIRIEYEALAGTKAVSNSEGGIDVTYAPYQIGESVSFVTVWMNDQDQVVATTIETADDTTSISKTIAIVAPAGATKAIVYTWKGAADDVKPLYANGVNVTL